ncbi:MAG TPA: BT_3928 family protein [Arachidicoccus sp.]
MKKAVLVIRWIVGLLFIFSGLIKANDTLGLSYKMQEFFEAWGMQSFDNYTFILSYLMNLFEIVLGVAMIVGFCMELFTWLILLLTVFFAFLTGYAALSGKFKTCWCFGDCLPLTPVQSFMKDVALLILILVIFSYRKKIKPLFRQKIVSIIIITIGVFIGIGFQCYTLKHLPVLDCLAYKKGNYLLQEMKVPPGAVADSSVVTFKYKKSGKIAEFDAEHFPADFDSTYEYVDRYDKLVRKGNATPAITDFALQTLSDNDTTQAILAQQDKYVLVLAKDFSDWQMRKNEFDDMLKAAAAKGMKVFVASPAAGGAQMLFAPTVTLLKLDAVVEKTAARCNPTYFLMEGDHILDKKSYADVGSFIANLDK